MCIKHYVYVIHSKAIDCYYKGYSQHPENRLAQHNAAQSKFTSRANDWELVFKEEFPTKNEALTRERVLKKYSRSQIEYLINSDRNML